MLVKHVVGVERGDYRYIEVSSEDCGALSAL